MVGQAVRANLNRSIRYPVLKLPPNGYLLGGALVTIVVQFLIPHVPATADAFEATVLDATDWLIVAVIAVIPAVIAEIVRRAGRVWVA